MLKVSESDAADILRDVEKEVGHNPDLIKTIVDFEGKNLLKRLKKKTKASEEASKAYL